MSTNSAAATSSNSSRVKSLAITAICLVLVYVFTSVVNIRLPFAPNGGLVHLGNVPLFVAAILFGKRTGMIVGCMGFVVGAITEKRKNMGFIVLALIAACAIKIVGYYFAEVVIYGNWVVPFTSIPGNLIQIGVAAVITLIIIKPLQAAAEHTILKKA